VPLWKRSGAQIAPRRAASSCRGSFVCVCVCPGCSSPAALAPDYLLSLRLNILRQKLFLFFLSHLSCCHLMRLLAS
jgi:hypothetical protein